MQACRVLLAHASCQMLLFVGQWAYSLKFILLPPPLFCYTSFLLVAALWDHEWNGINLFYTKLSMLHWQDFPVLFRATWPKLVVYSMVCRPICTPIVQSYLGFARCTLRKIPISLQASLPTIVIWNFFLLKSRPGASNDSQSPTSNSNSISAAVCRVAYSENVEHVSWTTLLCTTDIFTQSKVQMSQKGPPLIWLKHWHFHGEQYLTCYGSNIFVYVCFICAHFHLDTEQETTTRRRARERSTRTVKN